MQNMRSDDLLLYAVTDRSWVGKQTLLEQAESALKGGVTMLQLREKELSKAEFLSEAVLLKALCSKYNVPFIVNDDVEIATKSNADGIHVGQDDMELTEVRRLVGDKMLIGVSTQTVEQAIEAELNGADYLGVGAMFTTSTKLDADSVSYETLKAICNAVKIPVVAIGGINKKNMIELNGSGINGVALVSAIFATEDIENECRELKKIIKEIV